MAWFRRFLPCLMAVIEMGLRSTTVSGATAGTALAAVVAIAENIVNKALFAIDFFMMQS